MSALRFLTGFAPTPIATGPENDSARRTKSASDGNRSLTNSTNSAYDNFSSVGYEMMTDDRWAGRACRKGAKSCPVPSRPGRRMSFNLFWWREYATAVSLITNLFKVSRRSLCHARCGE